MDYARIKSEIKEIVDICSSVPEPFKQKCFELLFNQLLSGRSHPPKEEEKDKKQEKEGSQLLPISSQLRVFMKKTSVSEDELNAVLMYEGDDVHFIKEPTPRGVADGQIDWALLLALKNCILNNVMTVDPESVRSICQDKGYYDAPNFAAIFKRPKYKKLFKGIMSQQGTPQALTNDGMTELGTLIRQLAIS